MSLTAVKKTDGQTQEERPVYRCMRCGHVWAARDWKKSKHPPGTCPKCKSALWNIPKDE